MRPLCARHLARSGLLPGLMRSAGAASVIPTSTPLRAAEVGITPALCRKQGQQVIKVMRARTARGA
jgi:hypothetical protein